MDRLAAGIMIASAALVMNGGLVHEGVAEDSVASKLDVAKAGTMNAPAPVAASRRGERVLSLLLALEAVRAAPGLLDPSKV